MLFVTMDAAEAIKDLLGEPEVEGLRISAASMSLNSHGPGLEIELAAAPAPDDAVVETGDVRVFLDPPAAVALEDKVLDADIEAGEVRFTLRDQ